MMQIIGAILLVGGMTTLGMNFVARLKFRVNVISSFISALESINSEIYFKLTALPELIEKLAKECEGPARQFFTRCEKGLSELGDYSFSYVWRRAVADSEDLALTEEEKMVLLDLGAVLGRYEAEAQVKTIGYAITRMEAFLKKAEIQRDQQSKVYGTLGVAGGILAVILLV